MHRIFQAFALIILLFLTLAAGFTAGVMMDNRPLLPVTGLSDRDNGAASVSAQAGIDQNLIEEAYNLIQNHYADRETLEETNMTYSAISGMVEALGDTGHSRFMTPEMVEMEHQAIQGEFEGIGALLNVNDDGNPVILAPMDGSPAQEAGLKPGDIILEVDGVDVSQADLSEVVSRVTGPAGTEVTMVIMDPETDETSEVTITRERINVQDVSWQMLPGTDVAHVRVARFSQDVTDDLRDALREAQQQGAKGILLDLRNNPGGLLGEAIDVVSQFIREGYALQVKDADGNVRSVPVRRGGVALEIPIVALINGGSASAAEITAGALQDYGRATLVGEKTFGTGTVLNQFQLSDDSAILLATELWLTPKGRAIWHEGIAPDIEVELGSGVSISIPETERNLSAADLENLEDVQLKRGLEVLLEKVQ